MAPYLGYPFGMLMQGRTVILTGVNYRYGFDAQENDDEVKGQSNSMGAEFWEYDTRSGRRWNQDPKSVPVISPYATFGNSPIWKTDIKGDTPTVKEAALIAEDINNIASGGKTSNNLKGWKLINTNIQGVLYQDPNNGLTSGLYGRKKDNGLMEYTYATAGTENKADAIADVQALVGLSDQDKRSINNAKLISNGLGAHPDLTFVGHSKGGGQAAEDAMATNGYAITFNPATVVKNAIDMGKLNTNVPIDNYIVTGEILMASRIISKGQYGPPVGSIHYLTPATSDLTKVSAVPLTIRLHMIDAVNRAIDQAEKPVVVPGNIFTHLYNQLLKGLSDTENWLRIGAPR